MLLSRLLPLPLDPRGPRSLYGIVHVQVCVRACMCYANMHLHLCGADGYRPCIKMDIARV